MAKNYFDKASRKGKLTNVPTGETGHQSSGKTNKLTKKGQVYKNDLLNTDYTRQDMGTPIKLKKKGM